MVTISADPVTSNSLTPLESLSVHPKSVMTNRLTVRGTVTDVNEGIIIGQRGYSESRIYTRRARTRAASGGPSGAVNAAD